MCLATKQIILKFSHQLWLPHNSLILIPKTKYLIKFHRFYWQTQAYASPMSNQAYAGNTSCEAGTHDGNRIPSSDTVTQQQP